MTELVPLLLSFPDRREAGRSPVLDATGASVAWVRSGRSGMSFDVTDAPGRPLCAARIGWFSTTWEVTGPGGAALLRMRAPWWGGRQRVALARGGELTVRGSRWGRGFTVTDTAGDELVVAAPGPARRWWRGRDLVVQQTRAELGLAELVAVVQVWRLVSAAGASAGAAAAAGGAVAASSG